MVIAEQFQIDPQGEDLSAAISSANHIQDLSALQRCEKRIAPIAQMSLEVIEHSHFCSRRIDQRNRESIRSPKCSGRNESYFDVTGRSGVNLDALDLVDGFRSDALCEILVPDVGHSLSTGCWRHTGTIKENRLALFYLIAQILIPRLHRDLLKARGPEIVGLQI